MDIETGKIEKDSHVFNLRSESSSRATKESSSSESDYCDIIESSPPRRFKDDDGRLASSGEAALSSCPICLESSLIHPLIRSDTCGHAWCQECLLDYCEFQISHHRVPIPCPSSASCRHGQGGCPKHLSIHLVRNILSQQQPQRHQQSFLHKFNRLERMAQNPSLVACPRCCELVDEPPTSDQSIMDPQARTCSTCEHTFCSLHLDAHLGTTCHDYIMAATHHPPTLPPNTKPCSHCGAALQKYAGCDHVVCPACHDDMCFRCGTHVHLTGKVTRFCTQCEQGYLDHRYVWQIRLYYCLTLPFALPFVLAYSVVMTVLVLLSFCCCGCFGCGRWLKNNNSDGKRQTADPPRAFLYVTFIISLPLILMLYDGGYRFDVVDDFLEWSLVENPSAVRPDDDESVKAERDVVLPATPASSNISDE